MKRILAWVGITLMASALAACTGPSIPLSAQQGSTVILPFAMSELQQLLPLTEVGFGGSANADPQRGTLVVHLGDASGEALETRLAFSAVPNVAAPLGASGGVQGPNLLLVVDIPVDAPLGTHSIAVVRERIVDGVLEETVVTPSPQSITILPGSIDVALEGGGVETIEGAPTPLEFWADVYGWQPVVATSLPDVLPDPSFGVLVSTATWDFPASEPDPDRFVAYVEVDLSYPADVIDIERVVAREPVNGMVWWEDDGDGALTVYGLTSGPEFTKTGVGPFRVIFSLDDAASELLELADIQVNAFEVFDQTGSSSIATDWSLSTYLMAIR